MTAQREDFMQFRLSLSVAEAAILEYYAARYKKYTSQILRGLVRKAANDPAIDLAALQRWEAAFGPSNEDAEVRRELRAYIKHLSALRQGNQTPFIGQLQRQREPRSSAWESEFYRLRLTHCEAFMVEFWADRAGIRGESILRHLIWELATSDPGFNVKNFSSYARKAISDRPDEVRAKLDHDLSKLVARRKLIA